jgi:peptide/nickel transport system substrate-binding protein
MMRLSIFTQIRKRCCNKPAFSPIPIFVFIIFICCAVPTQLIASEIDPAIWPESWHEKAKIASELGIKQFFESPLLTTRVEAGELPPLRERLPFDPVVVEPLTQIGRYGGTARIFDSDWDKINNVEAPLTTDPTAAHILPNLIKHWQFDDDAKAITLTLKKGVKWSDGQPFTSDDYIFFHQHVLLDEELTPIPFPQWKDSKAIRISDEEFRFEFQKPFPLIINVLAQLGDYFVLPAHYMKQYHPAFTDRIQLIKIIRDEGYISWMAYFNAIRLWTRNTPPLAPTLRPFYLVERTPTAELYERNPWYWKVDTKGNQLPYIDRVRAEIIANQDVLAAKAATGQVDFAASELKTQDFPLFKLGEKTSGISVHVWRRIHASDVVLMPNFNIKDERLRNVFQDVRFRRALSVAIDREEMNSIIYFNRGVPRQVTVIPTSRFFEPEFATAYTQFDTVQAMQWLDEMGLIDTDGDGLREYSDGEPLVITLEFINFETPKQISLELVTSYWREVGLDFRLKEVDAALQAGRAMAGLMQMTAWHADRSTDILFPFQPQWHVPMHIGWEESHWNDWSIWHLSEGTRGEEPPPAIKQLQTWWVEMFQSTDQARVTELGKLILQSNAENVWTIGTVGLAPQPVIVSSRLKNVTPEGYWGWDNRWTPAYHPSTWYLEN